MLLAARGMALIATSLDMFRFDDGMDKITTPPMSYRPSIYSEVTKGQLLNFFGCGSARARHFDLSFVSPVARARGPRTGKSSNFYSDGSWLGKYFHFHFIHPESFHNLRIKYICNIQADARLRGLSS